MKKNIMLVIITAIICITGTSYAAYKLKAEQVSFNNKLLESNDVQSAIDEISYLIKDQIGNNDISDIGDGTITGAIKTINEQKNEQNIYSTKEHAIGTWIDGSTIYEKTYKLTGTDKMGYSGSIVYNVLETNPNIKSVIGFSGCVNFLRVKGNTHEFMPLNHTVYASGLSSFVSYIKETSQLRFGYGASDPSGSFKELEFYVSVKYTKITE